jgi:tetratricopeptide (TPR) repeat protein
MPLISRPLRLAAPALFLALAVLPALAAAQSSQDIDWCNGKNGATAEQSIAGCSNLLHSEKFKAKSTIILVLRGWAYKNAKRYDDAIADFSAALRVDPTNANALNGRGETYIFKEDFRKAYADYDALTRAVPTDWRGFNGRAVARVRFDPDKGKEIADLKEAQRLAPNHPWPLINLTEAHIAMNQTATALQECRRVKELVKGGAMGPRLCGAAYFKSNDLKAAAPELEVAIGLNDPMALYLRGLLKERQGDTAGAKIDIEKAKAKWADVAESARRDFGPL